MITRMREAGLLWPALFLLVTFPVLIALGNWQWSRMHWKQGLIADLERAAKAEPVKLSAVRGYSGGKRPDNADIEAMRFRRIQVTGTFDHTSEFHVWAPQNSGPSWSVVTPLRISADTTAGAAATHILVIRGVVPAATKSADVRLTGQPAGPQSIIGRVRLNRPNDWANEPNIDKNEWFTRDLRAMVQHLRASSTGEVAVAPFFLEAEQQTGGPSAPQPHLQALNLSNRHFEYALTWWGLAATLAGVFAVFAWGRLNSAKA